MGKRQVRIFRNQIFSKRLQLEGNSGHVILADHVVYSGKIRKISERNLVLLDLRQHQHTFEMAAIQEVVFDKETDY